MASAAFESLQHVSTVVGLVSSEANATKERSTLSTVAVGVSDTGVSETSLKRVFVTVRH